MQSKRVISPELLNAHAHDAKHVLLFATLRNCQDQSDPLRSLIILPVPQPISSTVYLALFAKSYTSAKQGDDSATDSENTFATSRKTTKTHLNRSPDTLICPIILSNICGLSLQQGSAESRKTLEQKFIFQIGTLNPHGINERFSFN